jgi:outer membrane lipase/esterase
MPTPKPRFLLQRNWARWLASWALAVLAAGGCGGGSNAIQAFIPDRVISFGDEASLLLADGSRYGINGLDANNALDCTLQPLWTQIVISVYGYVFEQCNPSKLTPKAFQRASAGAKVADLVVQVDAQAKAGLSATDLVTVMVGSNDIVELYRQYAPRVAAGEAPALVADDLNAQALLRGAAVAEQVNRLIDLGPRVIVSTVPALHLTPYGIAENTADPARGALLRRLSETFNARIRVDILQDGRHVGLVSADDSVQLLVNAAAVNGLTDIVAGACAVALPGCTTATLVTGATAINHLWADELHFAPLAHTSIGNQAANRARLNPF